jgi:molybdopterin adenylyltransferase
MAGMKYPLIPHPVPNVDLGHALDERAELRFVEVLADPAKSGRDVVLSRGESDPALHVSSIHDCNTRIVRALSVASARKADCCSMRVAILTISTAGARGERKDTSGDAILAWARDHRYDVAARALVSDDVNAIVRQLLELTTGGTGLSPTDVTPEATAVVIERDVPGIAEWLRGKSVNSFPKAALSRGRSGVRNKTLIVNLPGSPGGVKDSLAALDPIVDHAVAVLRGDIGDHGGGSQ